MPPLPLGEGRARNRASPARGAPFFMRFPRHNRHENFMTKP